MDREAAKLATAIGARVKQERQARGWTLDQLAGAASVSRRMVVSVEQGAVNPSVGTLLRLSDALGVGLPALVEPPEPKIGEGDPQRRGRRAMERRGRRAWRVGGRHDTAGCRRVVGLVVGARGSPRERGSCRRHQGTGARAAGRDHRRGRRPGHRPRNRGCRGLSWRRRPRLRQSALRSPPGSRWRCSNPEWGPSAPSEARHG